jgi:hypothetical protein
MAGVYFIAAGQSSRNRSKSLDKSLEVVGLLPFVDSRLGTELLSHFGEDGGVFAWGANRVGDLDKLERGDYVVDVKNKQVVQIFKFQFYTHTSDTRLQRRIGWDDDKPANEQRPYDFIYFLSDPENTKNTKKSYFQTAFDEEKNRNWLVGQRWFSEEKCQLAISRAGCQDLEDLMGINNELLSHPGGLGHRSNFGMRRREFK